MVKTGLLLNSISGCFPDWTLGVLDIDLSWSRDMVGHITTPFPIGACFFVKTE